MASQELRVLMALVNAYPGSRSTSWLHDNLKLTNATARISELRKRGHLIDNVDYPSVNGVRRSENFYRGQVIDGALFRPRPRFLAA